MNSMTRRQRIVTGMVLLTAIFGAFFVAPAQAQTVEPADQWKFSPPPVWFL